MPSAPEEAPAPAKALETEDALSSDNMPKSAQPEVTKPKPAPPTAAQDDRKIAAARQKAKSVFGAKQAPRSRALLLAGVALAVVAGCAVFGWYYWQIAYDSTRALARSGSESFRVSGSSAVIPPGMVQQVSQAPQPEVVASVPPAVAAPAQAAEAVEAKPTVPHPQGVSPPGARRYAATTARQEDSDPLRARARAESSPPANTPAPKDDTAIRIRQSTATNQVHPLLGKAYQSFIAGDIETSQRQYHKMLQQEPNNRDALLGMAAIALSRKQAGQSAAYYGKLLELDPADPDALAGLIGLQGQTDPVQSESRLKKILAQNPQANAVHFALGNLYSQQSRWAEAQQAFFRAYSGAPGNADYAYNLAVSLDHLNQGKPALDYYQRALALGQSGPANFDKASVHNRVKELQPAASN